MRGVVEDVLVVVAEEEGVEEEEEEGVEARVLSVCGLCAVQLL